MERKQKVITVRVEPDIYDLLTAFVRDVLGEKSLSACLRKRMLMLAQELVGIYSRNRLYSIEEKQRLRDRYVSILKRLSEL